MPERYVGSNWFKLKKKTAEILFILNTKDILSSVMVDPAINKTLLLRV
jgi:hypothetical protein